MPDAVYRRGYITLKPGEILVLFTDGVTERGDPRQSTGEDHIVEFGRDGLIETIQGVRSDSAETIAQTILQKVRDFGHGRPFEDDVSVMVIRRLPAENYPPEEVPVSDRDAGEDPDGRPRVRIGSVSRFAPNIIYAGYQPIMDYLNAQGPTATNCG